MLIVAFSSLSTRGLLDNFGLSMQPSSLFLRTRNFWVTGETPVRAQLITVLLMTMSVGAGNRLMAD